MLHAIGRHGSKDRLCQGSHPRFIQEHMLPREDSGIDLVKNKLKVDLGNPFLEDMESEIFLNFMGEFDGCDTKILFFIVCPMFL